MASRGWYMLDELRTILPPEAVAALIDRFGGQTIRIPSRLRESRQERTRRALAALTEQSYPEAARSTGIALRTVKRHAKRSA